MSPPNEGGVGNLYTHVWTSIIHLSDNKQSFIRPGLRSIHSFHLSVPTFSLSLFIFIIMIMMIIKFSVLFYFKSSNIMPLCIHFHPFMSDSFHEQPHILSTPTICSLCHFDFSEDLTTLTSGATPTSCHLRDLIASDILTIHPS